MASLGLNELTDNTVTIYRYIHYMTACFKETPFISYNMYPCPHHNDTHWKLYSKATIEDYLSYVWVYISTSIKKNIPCKRALTNNLRYKITPSTCIIRYGQLYPLNCYYDRHIIWSYRMNFISKVTSFQRRLTFGELLMNYELFNHFISWLLWSDLFVH